MALSIPGTAFLAVELAHMPELEAMLLTLTAGFFMANIAVVRGQRFVRAVEQSSPPVYALLFALGVLACSSKRSGDVGYGRLFW